MVLGASGSGKSSLVRAGLVHKLQIGNLTSGSWHILPIIRPVNQAGDLPLNNLKQALLQQKTKQNNLLIVDQFEEIFTLVSDRDQQNQFFQYLFAQEKVYRVIVMRSDFFPHTQNHRELAQSIEKNLFSISPMTADELRQAVEQPAKQAGYAIEPSLTAELIHAINTDPAHLPLLQYVLEKVFQESKKSSDKQLTLHRYQQLGELKGALAKKAQQLYDNLNDNERTTFHG